MSLSPVSTPAFRQTSCAGGTLSQSRGLETSKPSARSSTSTSVPSASSAATIAAPIPERPPVTIAVSGNEDNFSHRPAALEQVERVVDLFERQLGADERLEGAAVPEVEQLGERLAHDLRAQRGQPAEVEAVDGDVAADEELRADVAPRAGGEADRDDRAERVQRLQRVGEDGAADRVEDVVDLDRRRELVVAVGLLRAELERDLLLLRTAGGGHDTRAEVPRALDRRRADAAGRRVHEHRLALLYPRLARQRDPRGQVGQQEGRALGE